MRYRLLATVCAVTLITPGTSQAGPGSVYAAEETQPRDSRADCNTNGIVDDIEISPLEGAFLFFDGENDYVDPGASPFLDALGQDHFTIEAWIWTEDNTNSVLIGNAGSDPNLWNFVIRGYDQGGVIRLRINDGQSEHYCNGATRVNDGVWHHVAVVREVGWTGSLKIYVDGVLDGSLDVASHPFTAQRQTYIGRDAVTSRFYGGAMDELRVWVVARSGEEIAADMYRTLNGGIGLAAQWRFDEGSGSTTVESVDGNPGNLIGPPVWGLQADDCNSNGILDECEAGGTADCNANGTADFCDIGAGFSQDCNVNGIPDECEAGGADDCNENGTSDLCDIYTGASADCNANAVPDECEALPSGVVYVDDDAASGANNGTSWANAFLDVQSALSYAEGCGGIDEIRVAGGTYTPGASLEDSFWLVNGVALRGGYRGLASGGDPDDRDIDAFATILSGDIGVTGDPSDNCYHVVMGSLTDASAVVEGFTITGGYNPTGEGAGVYIADGGPTFVQCVFTANSADDGAGIYNEDASPTIERCIFLSNAASGDGGGIYNKDDGNPTISYCSFMGNAAANGGGVANRDSNPTLSHCIFHGNGASNGGALHSTNYSEPTLNDCVFSGNTASNGGGMYNANSSKPTLTNCAFSGNRADHGGGITNFQSSPELFFCTFSGNAAAEGGGIDNLHSSRPWLINCMFAGNSAGRDGGGINNFSSSSPVLLNCVFTGNRSGKYGGGVNNSQSCNPGLTNCTFSGNWATVSGGAVYSAFSSTPRVRNCVLWSIGAPGDAQIRGNATVSYSCVQGGAEGEGNIDADPLLDGDLRLTAGSPCIDAGDNTVLPPDYDDLDGDGDTYEPLSVDHDGLARFVDDPDTPDTGNPGELGAIVDMGAYEFGASATASADLDHDGDVDLQDFAIFQQQFTGP